MIVTVCTPWHSTLNRPSSFLSLSLLHFFALNLKHSKHRISRSDIVKLCRLWQSQIIQTSATNYLPQITTILNTMSRQLLLIFKTNDLLRGIESSLRGSIESSHRAHQTQTAFIAMSRCCVRAVSQEQTELCRGRLLCRLHSATQMYWILLKLSTYEMYLQLKDWVCRWIPGIRSSAEKVYVRRLGEVLLSTGAS